MKTQSFNTLIHTAKVVTVWHKKDSRRVERLMLLPQSPDLYFIERLRCSLEKEVTSRHPASSSLRDLEINLGEEAIKIPLVIIITS